MQQWVLMLERFRVLCELFNDAARDCSEIFTRLQVVQGADIARVLTRVKSGIEFKIDAYERGIIKRAERLPEHRTKPKLEVASVKSVDTLRNEFRDQFLAAAHLTEALSPENAAVLETVVTLLADHTHKIFLWTSALRSLAAEEEQSFDLNLGEVRTAPPHDHGESSVQL